MTTARLWDAFAGAWSQDGALINTFEFGVQWQPPIGGFLREMSWFRNQTTVGNKPNTLRVWDSVTQTAIYTASSVPDSGAVGWQRHTVNVSVPVVAGRTYIVSAVWPIGTSESFVAWGSKPEPDYPLAFIGTQSRFHSPNGAGIPDTNTGGVVAVGLDVEWSDEAPGEQPATPGDLGNALAAWLSTTEGTQGDSAPLQDHATLGAVSVAVGETQDQQNEWAFGLGAAAHGYFGDLKGLIADIKTVTDTLPTPIAQLTSIVLDHYTADIEMILGQIDSVLSNLGAQSTDLSGTAGSAVGALSGRTGFPATGWTMAAEADFEDAIAFAEPADAYVVNVTSYQSTQPATESPAGLWLYRLGWWCVLNGSLASRREFVEFQQQLLTDGGRRMPGCAIQLKPGTLATVQAWLLA